MLSDKNECQNNEDVNFFCFCDGRQPWILWWKRIWKLTWPAGTFRNTSKRILSLSTLNIFLNDPTWKRDSQGINSVLQHALVSQVDTQQRTFQGLLNMTLSDSRDSWSRSKHIDELNVGSTGQLCPERGDKHSRETGRESAYHDM